MRPFFLLSLSLLLSGAAFAATEPALQIAKPVYQWRTESDIDKKTGTLNHCLVKNMYDNGTVLMIAENAQGVRRLALHFPQDKMAPGEHYDLTLQVDKRDVFPAEAVAVSPQILTIGIPDVLPDQMRQGQALYLRGPNDEVVYTLEGANGAVMALQDCIETSKSGGTKPAMTEQTDDAAFEAKMAAEKAAAAKPAETKKDEAKAEPPKPAEKPETVVAMNAPPAPVKTPEAPKTEAKKPETKKEPVKQAEKKPQKKNETKNEAKKKAEAKKTEPKKAPVPQAPKTLLPEPLHGVFKAALLEPQTLLLKPQVANDKPLDFAWMKDMLFVGVKKMPTAPVADFDAVATDYLRKLRARCTGPFVAEVSPPAQNTARNINWLVAEAACAPNGKDDTIAALIFTNDTSGLTIYFVEAPAAQGSEAIRARDRLIAAIFR